MRSTKYSLGGDGLRLIAGVLLLDNGSLETLVLEKRDGWLATLSDDEDVRLTRGEVVPHGIFDADNFVGSRMFLSQLDDTNTTDVMPAGDHAQVPDLKLDNVLNLTRLNVDTHGIVNFGNGIRIADGTRVMGGDVGNALHTSLLPLDLAEFKCALLLGNKVKLETTLGIVEKSESLVGLLDGDDIHEASRVCLVGTDLSVDLDQSLHDDRVRLATSQGVLETVAKDQVEREGFAQLVGSSGRTRRPHAAHLVQHPVRRRIQALQMLLRSARHLARVFVSLPTAGTRPTLGCRRRES